MFSWCWTWFKPFTMGKIIPPITWVNNLEYIYLCLNVFYLQDRIAFLNWICLVGDSHPSKINHVNISWWYPALVANNFWVYRRLNNHPKVDFIINEISLYQSESESCLKVQNLAGYHKNFSLNGPWKSCGSNQFELK